MSDYKCKECGHVGVYIAPLPEEPPVELSTVPPQKQFEWAVEMYRVAVSNAYWMRGDPSNRDREAKEKTARAALVAIYERQAEALEMFREEQSRDKAQVASLSSRLERLKAEQMERTLNPREAELILLAEPGKPIPERLVEKLRRLSGTGAHP